MRKRWKGGERKGQRYKGMEKGREQAEDGDGARERESKQKRLTRMPTYEGIGNTFCQKNGALDSHENVL